PPTSPHPHPSSSYSTHSAPTDLYTLSLHDALPISATPSLGEHTILLNLAAETLECDFKRITGVHFDLAHSVYQRVRRPLLRPELDRKSTRLNSSHGSISYAVFCLKKKKNHNKIYTV